MSLIYALFAALDNVVYKIAGVLFNVIYRLAYTEIINADVIKRVSDNIYLVLGILMLFKVIVSAIQYIVNPDTFSDKEKGMFGILKNAVITVILIAFVPTVFRFAISVQEQVIDALPRIILGTRGINEADKSAGENLAYEVLLSFISVNKKNDGCIAGYDNAGNKQTSCSVGDHRIHDITSFASNITAGVGFFDDNGRVFNYMYIISTIGGCFLAYILLSMCLDIAIRTIKLGIIQMLAPIPISSYMFKKDNFNKFVKTSFQVYADLFIRMAVIYVILFVIQLVPGIIAEMFSSAGKTYFQNDSILERALATIALVFGLLMFAKSAPKFVTDLLGLPDVGSGDLKEMFKPAWQRAGGVANAAINPFRTAGAAALTSFQNGDNLRGNHQWWKNIKRVGRAAGAGLRGGLMGSLDSLQGVAAGDDAAKMRERMRKRDSGDFARAYRAKYYRGFSRTEAIGKKASAAVARVQSFFGQTPVNSEGYKSAASTLKTLRDEAFVSRSLGEMGKEANKLTKVQTRTFGTGGPNSTGTKLQISVDGNPPRDVQNVFSYTDSGGKKYEVSYEAVHAVMEKFNKGQKLEDADYIGLGIAPGDVNTLKAVHDNIEKKAGIEYVNVAVAAQERLKSDPTLSATERSELEKLADSEVLDRIDRYREAIGALNIPADEKKKLFDSLRDNPGSFMAGANPTIQHYLTISAQMAKMEQMQSEGKK